MNNEDSMISPTKPFETHPLDNEGKRRLKFIEELCRGELAAVETYQQVLEDAHDHVEIATLEDFIEDHKQAFNFWKEQSIEHHGKSLDSLGVWGRAAKAFVGTTKIFGEIPALRALKEGEEHGLKEYEKFMESGVIEPLQKDAILNQFLPNQKRHVERLENIIKMQLKTN